MTFDWASPYGDPASLASAHFQQLVGDHLTVSVTFGYQAAEFETLTDPLDVFPPEWTVVDEWRYRDRVSVLGRLDARTFALLTLSAGQRSMHAEVASFDVATARTMIARFEARTTPVESVEGDLAVRFWSHHPMAGGVSYTREIAAPVWTEARENYATDLHPLLDPLMAMSGPPESGRIMILHGEPGSGKTNLLRMLGQEWSSWCDAEYVIDSDEFFANASYMTSVMLGEYDDERWRLLIVEDADELIAANAHARSGQGTARLLNLADGMLGQGLRVLVCVTTNEPVEALSEAIVRPGRCFANIHVGALSADDAAVWRAAHDLPAKDGGASLAELYGECRSTITASATPADRPINPGVFQLDGQRFAFQTTPTISRYPTTTMESRFSG